MAVANVCAAYLAISWLVGDYPGMFKLCAAGGILLLNVLLAWALLFTE